MSYKLERALNDLAPLLAVVAIVAVVLFGARWLLLRRSLALGHERQLPRQLVMLALTLFSVIAIVLVLPVSDATRSDLLTVLGLLASAVITLSSTTLVANAMAGLMLRATRSFRPGDYIRVGNEAGRVSDRGLFHTEIQTEDRDLTTLPNMWLITNPVTVMRASGTFISTTLSLGYDVDRRTIETLLLDAAEQAELTEPFVRVLELGDFSVTYRVAGFLADTKQLLTMRSNLAESVLDVLHDNAIEIVSPTFMNQRQISADAVIPQPTKRGKKPAERSEPAPEERIFDKAAEAERRERDRAELEQRIKELEGRLSRSRSSTKKATLQAELDGHRQKLAELVDTQRAKTEESADA